MKRTCTGTVRAAPSFAALVACFVAAAARAEVWPLPGDALARGPWALLEESACGAWSNPATARPARSIALGAARHIAFDLEEWARHDAAASFRAGAAHVALGWTRFGEGDLAANGAALGGGAPLARDRLRAGVWMRRHQRRDDVAWCADFGVLAAPHPRGRVAVVSRSALRGGEPAPDGEWEVAAAWDESGGGAAIAVARDAGGPLSLTVGTRVAIGSLQAHASLSRLAGGETRAALSVVATLPGGIGFAAAREVGPRLPDSRAVALGWNPVPPSRSAGTSSARPPAVAKAAPDSAATADSRDEDALERLRREIEDREEEEPSAGPTPRQEADEPEPSPRSAAARALVTSGELRTALIGGPRSALALHGAAAVSRAFSPRLSASAAAALSRDAGERGAIDESRLSAVFSHRGSWTVFAGDLDVRFGEGLVADAPAPRSGNGLQVAPAARAGRAPIPAGRGGALRWAPARRWRIGAFALRTARDAREMNGAWVPAGGRYHRSPLELARRGALSERLAGIHAGADFAGERVFVSLLRASYGSPLRLPGGHAARGLGWCSLGGSFAPSGVRVDGEAAFSSRGRALAIELRRPIRRGALASLTFRGAARSEEYTAASAWPGSAISRRWEAVARWRPPRPLHGLALRALEEWWSNPSASTGTDRHGWRRETEIAAGVRHGGAHLGVECGGQESRREVAASAVRYAAAVFDPWFAARLEWPASERLRLTLAARASRRGGVWREQWGLSGKFRSRSTEMRFEAAFRPGAAAASAALESDPLGGLVLDRSSSPSRCTMEIERTLGGGRSPPALGVRVTARAVASSESPRVAVWSWIASRGARSAPPVE